MRASPPLGSIKEGHPRPIISHAHLFFCVFLFTQRVLQWSSKPFKDFKTFQVLTLSKQNVLWKDLKCHFGISIPVPLLCSTIRFTSFLVSKSIIIIHLFTHTLLKFGTFFLGVLINFKFLLVTSKWRFLYFTNKFYKTWLIAHWRVSWAANQKGFTKKLKRI